MGEGKGLLGKTLLILILENMIQWGPRLYCKGVNKRGQWGEGASD